MDLCHSGGSRGPGGRAHSLLGEPKFTVSAELSFERGL